MKKNIFNHDKKYSRNIYDEENKFKYKKPVYVKDDLETLNRLFKRYSKKKFDYKNKTSVSAGSAYKTFESDQRVTFKMSYSNSKSSHDRYIEYYMPQMNKDYVEEKPELFGMDIHEYKKYETPLNFKCIIAPESQNIDLKTLVESYIKRVENQTGYKLCWMACIHSDTDHKHAHVVINGKDLNGEDVFFNKDTIKLMRYMCSNAATQMIGDRTVEQIQAAKNQYISAKRWTDLDEKILRKSEERNGMINRENISSEFDNRLLYLSKLKLSSFDKAGNVWKLKSDYQEVLKTAGRYNSFLEEYEKSDQELEIYTGGEIKGKVEKVITFSNKESWNDAIIVNSENRHIYVPVWQLHKDNLKGKNIIIRNKGDDVKISRQISDKNIIIE